ncbi:hypothetical protein ACFODL_01295 [Phenylobacterium terrae]|uniref:Energy transducer TonB n=1 Tax=Phenylobacterium terrae TaxID=2665495 RepID=A0ABW4MWT2_9CAUL
MSLDSTAPQSGIRDEPGVHHELHDHGQYSARASIGEKVFIWLGWALAAGFIALTMGLYFPGFLASSPDTDPMPAAPAAASAPAAAPVSQPAALPATPAQAPAAEPAAP